MADTHNDSVDRVKIRYGLLGGNDHEVTFYVTGPSDFGVYDLLPYDGPDVSDADVIIDPAGTPYQTVVDWANGVCAGFTRAMDGTIAINAIIIEQLSHDLNVEAVKACNVYSPFTFGNGNPTGITGQFLMMQGYNEAGRKSKRMIGGISNFFNSAADNIVASPLPTGSATPQDVTSSLVQRIQGLPVNGVDVQHWGITSQFDTDRELTVLVGNFSNVFIHNVNKRWRKRFNY
jgi:hypothetical protein